MIDDELKQALQEVKDECQKHGVCYRCKFHESHGCALKGRPDKWIIGTISADKWHTLYSWLVDIRSALAPDPKRGSDDFTARKIRTDLVDEIIDYMNELGEEERNET